MSRATTRLRDLVVGLVTAAALALAGAPAATADDPADPPRTASITGTVVFPEGLEEGYSQGFDVSAWTVDGQEPWVYGDVSVSGADFTISGLIAGQDYWVSISFWHYELTDGLWAGSGQPLVRSTTRAAGVHAGTTGLLVQPVKKASPTSISGTVRLPEGVASIDGTRVVASTHYTEDNQPTRTAVVQDSSFVLTGLSPHHSYSICLEASASTLAGCWQSDELPFFGTADSWQSLDAGSEDVILMPQRRTTISGTVVLPAGVTSLDGLTIYASGERWWEDYASTTLKGTTFTITGLGSYGSYELSVSGSDEVEVGYYVGDTQGLSRSNENVLRVKGDGSPVVLRPVATWRPETPVTSTAKPTVTGTVKIGATLTAKPGTWSVTGTTHAYQWLRNGTAISGATKSTYKVAAADAGTKLSVRVTASKAGYASGQAASASTATVPFLKFTSTTKPTVTGTARVGVKLTAKPGTWSVSGLTYSYQWLRNGAAISGATASTYTATASDAGKKLAVKVVARRTGYTSLSATSAATGGVAKGVITNRTKPAVTGSVKVGGTLTAKPGTWSPSAPTLRYQWLRGGKAITGATAATYTPVAADLGQRLSVKVTASRSGYTTVSATSAATGAVARGTITSTARPTITGTAAVASRLTAGSGTWSTTGLTLGYQWLRDGTAITGATSSAYTPVAGDVGKKLTVRVTAKKNGYTSTTATSVATAAVAKATPTVTALPVAASVPAGLEAAVRVAVSVPGVAKPTGTIVVTAGTTTVTATLATTANGSVTVTLPALDAGTYDVVAAFTPTGTTATTASGGTSAPATLTVVAPPTA